MTASGSLMRLISRRTGRRRADDTAALEMSHPSFRVILKTPEKETSMIALGAIHSYVRWLSDRELLSKTVSGIVDASSQLGVPVIREKPTVSSKCSSMNATAAARMGTCGKWR